MDHDTLFFADLDDSENNWIECSSCREQIEIHGLTDNDDHCYECGAPQFECETVEDHLRKSKHWIKEALMADDDNLGHFALSAGRPQIEFVAMAMESVLEAMAMAKNATPAAVAEQILRSHVAIDKIVTVEAFNKELDEMHAHYVANDNAAPSASEAAE